MVRYGPVVFGTFKNRKNRFTAEVLIDGEIQIVHVKNTGRCRMALIEGVQVALEKNGKPGRKTAFDLIAAYREDCGWINVDSQVPNRLVKEALEEMEGVTFLKPEYSCGDSRMDFYLEMGERKILMEVKGCTLAEKGTGLFPDAPTARGERHLRELEKAVREGFEAVLVFVIAVSGVEKVLPNAELDPIFKEAYERAVSAGVQILCVPCETGPDWIRIAGEFRL